jgi:hypothetical protein
MQNTFKRLIVPVSFGILSSLILFVISLGELSVSPDSVVYLYAGETFSAGQGLRDIRSGLDNNYLNHYPPLLPLLISVVGDIFTSGNYMKAAGFLNSLFYGATIFLLSFITGRETKNYKFTIFVTVFYVTVVGLARIHLYVWSEPIFIFMSILSLWVLEKHFRTGSFWWLFISAVCMCIAALDRYIAIVLIGSGGLSLLLFSKHKLVKRLLLTSTFGFISSVGLIAWFIRNNVLDIPITGRKVKFHPMIADYYKKFAVSVKEFLFQVSTGKSESLIIGVALLIIFLITVIKFRTTIRHTLKESRYLKILTIYGTAYFTFLAISNTFFDHTPLYYRITFPAFIIFALIAFLIIYRNRTSLSTRFNKLIWIISIAYLGINTLFFVRSLVNFHPKGINNAKWKNSEIATFLKNTPKETTVYVDRPGTAYFLANRVCHRTKKLKTTTITQETIVVLFRKKDLVDQLTNPDSKSNNESITVKRKVVFDKATVYYID